MNLHSEITRGALRSEADVYPAEQDSWLIELLRILRSRSKLIIFPAAVVVAVTLIIVSQLPSMYTAGAVVMLDQRKNNVENVNAVLSGLPTDPSSVQNQVLILTSRALAAHVVESLRLDLNPEFAPGSGWKNVMTGISHSLKWLAHETWLGVDNFSKWAVNEMWPGRTISSEWLKPDSWTLWDAMIPTDTQTKLEKQDQIIDTFLGRLDVTPINLSTALMVNFQARDPNNAARIANAIANAYVEDQLNAKFEATRKATEWLSARIQQLATQVQAADAAVQQYKADNNLAETAEGSSVVNQQLGALSAQVILAKSALAAKQAAYSRVQSLVKSGHSADVSEVVASPLISQLRAQETELMRQEAQLSTQFGPRHPKMIDLMSQKRNLEGKIGQEVRRVIETVANDVAVAQANLQSLQQSMKDLEGRSEEQSKASVKLKALEANAGSVRLMYQAFLSRLKEIQGQEGIQTPDARVVSTAMVPTSPSFPKPLLTVGASIPVGLALGLILALLAERLDTGFRTPSQVEKLLGLPVLATIPEMPGDNGRWAHSPSDQVIDKPMSSYTESIRGLQFGIELSNVDRKPKVIMVASAMPAEGKTTVAVSLGRIAARNGKKVIILDADLRHPNVAKAVRLTDIRHGIVEALTGSTAAEKCVLRDPKSDMLVMAVKQSKLKKYTRNDPAELLGSQMMEKLIANLRNAFDLVIIDSAPLLPVNDSKVLIHLTDAVLVVARWESTPREAVANAVRSLADLGAGIAGVALTRADMTRFRYYSYQGYDRYKEYYTE